VVSEPASDDPVVVADASDVAEPSDVADVAADVVTVPPDELELEHADAMPASAHTTASVLPQDERMAMRHSTARARNLRGAHVNPVTGFCTVPRVAPPDTPPTGPRIDPWLGTVVQVVTSRQDRPNLPSVDCPFCPGGTEARAAAAPDAGPWTFVNRWPSMPDGRCEIVVYDADHDVPLSALGAAGVRAVVDVWAARSEALGRRDDVAYVLVFENRGEEVGATIAHPHGQIYAYDHVPVRPRQLLAAGWRPDADAGDRLVAELGGWRAWVPQAPVHPVAVTLAPTEQVPDLPALDDRGRDDMAALLHEVLLRLDALYATPLPFMLWINQCPADGERWPQAWLNVEIVSPWRAAGVARHIAAAELGGGELFLPVEPEHVAARLRELGRS
jgi:UDPglucose--hexose-1-phosphate uridylyltransferase